MRIIDAPARLIEVSVSAMTRSRSSQPFAGGRLDHRVLAADLVRRDRHRAGVGDRAQDVEVRQRRLDHDDVGALGDVERDLGQRVGDACASASCW